MSCSTALLCMCSQLYAHLASLGFSLPKALMVAFRSFLASLSVLKAMDLRIRDPVEHVVLAAAFAAALAAYRETANTQGFIHSKIQNIMQWCHCVAGHKAIKSVNHVIIKVRVTTAMHPLSHQPLHCP